MADVSGEDPRITVVTAALRSQMRLEVIADQVLTGVVYLDGRHFVRCVFRDVVLITTIGVHFVDASCTWEGRLDGEIRWPCGSGIGLADFVRAHGGTVRALGEGPLN